MEFFATTLDGPTLIKSSVNRDERGYFLRARCETVFTEHGLPARFVQTSVSYNQEAGTFRGLHYQVPPSREGKLVRCIAGAMDDVLVDLRPDSKTYLEHEWIRLDAKEPAALFVPSGFAHGFITAEEHTYILYEMTDFYAPNLGRGIRWNDPKLRLKLPRSIRIVSPRDVQYADLDTKSLDIFLDDH